MSFIDDFSIAKLYFNSKILSYDYSISYHIVLFLSDSREKKKLCVFRYYSAKNIINFTVIQFKHNLTYYYNIGVLLVYSRIILLCITNQNYMSKLLSIGGKNGYFPTVNVPVHFRRYELKKRIKKNNSNNTINLVSDSNIKN